MKTTSVTFGYRHGYSTSSLTADKDRRHNSSLIIAQTFLGMLVMARRCRRKQLILITNVQREERDCFGPSSEQIAPTQTTAGRIQREGFMEEMRVGCHVPSICCAGRGRTLDFPCEASASCPYIPCQLKSG